MTIVGGVVVLVMWTWRGVIIEQEVFRQRCNAVLDIKAPFSSRKFSTISKIQNIKIFNVF